VGRAVTERDHVRVRVAYIVRSWPRLSQTFIVNEVLALERLGLALVIFRMIAADEPEALDQVAEVRSPVHDLKAAQRRDRVSHLTEHLSVLLGSPTRYLRTVAFVLRGRRLAAGYSTTTRATCFRHAVHLAALARSEQKRGRPFDRIHAHFAHDPALVGLLAHQLTGISFSLTAHARDLYGIPPDALAARARAASAVVTCCAANAEYLRRTVDGARVHLVHHGVDLERFHPRPRLVESKLPLILSVGRLVEKKGFFDLLEACAGLTADGHRFHCAIYGDGPLLTALEARCEQLGLADTVTLAGARSPRELVPLFQRADVFALTPFITDGGDRDGVPNVLVEAMACGVPVVSTAVGGIPDLVRHGENGLLAAPHDVAAVARHLGELLADADRRRAMGAAARVTVERGFDARTAARRLATLLGAGSSPASGARHPSARSPHPAPPPVLARGRSRLDTPSGGTRCR
jgi:glycosyltransferase involved in cell wall biosynthesis